MLRFLEAGTDCEDVGVGAADEEGGGRGAGDDAWRQNGTGEGERDSVRSSSWSGRNRGRDRAGWDALALGPGRALDRNELALVLGRGWDALLGRG